MAGSRLSVVHSLEAQPTRPNTGADRLGDPLSFDFRSHSKGIAVAEAKRMSGFQGKLLKAVMSRFSKFQAQRYLKSGGRKMGQLLGRDICVVTMRGARTGKIRQVPLMLVPYDTPAGPGVILVASLGGAPENPTWYYNLVAHPEIEVQVRDESLKLRARRASKEEKAQVWPLCVEHYPDYQSYQDRTDRDIPVFLCEPR